MRSLIITAILLGGAIAAPSELSENVRITNGQNAERNQFPYQVAFDWGYIGIWSFICGGSILNEFWVLTAGHCITESLDFGGFRVRAGLLNLNEDLPSVQYANVLYYVLHENYPGGVNPFDIAVLRLETPLTFTEAVQPIALPAADSIPTGEAVVSGWGSVSTGYFPEHPNTLQTVTVSLIGMDECEAAYRDLFPGQNIPLASTDVCTGPLFSQIATCGRDFGGPLAQDGQLIGVMSWGVSPCGFAGAPSVHVRVSAFVDWINANIA